MMEVKRLNEESADQDLIQLSRKWAKSPKSMLIRAKFLRINVQRSKKYPLG